MKNLHFIIAGGLLAGALILPARPAVADQKDGKEHPAKDAHGNLHIPPGHLPPPGQCRTWYPNRSPGHQPAPGSCRLLSRRVPQGAWLVSHDRIWKYYDRSRYDYLRHPVYYGKPDSHDDHRYPRGAYDGRSHSSRNDIREDIRDIREARKDVRQDREQLEKNREELQKDRAELRQDSRNGASGKEIRQDLQKIADSKKDLRQSQNRLEAARQELKEDLRKR